MNDVKAVVQILAKLSFCGHLPQIAVCRRDDSNIDPRGGLIRTDLLNFAGFRGSGAKRPACAAIISPTSSINIVAAVRDLELA